MAGGEGGPCPSRKNNYQHYWIIKEAKGPVSQGCCDNCGLTQEFKNYVQASTWGDDHRSSGPLRQKTLAEEEDDAEEELQDAYEEVAS